MVARKGTQTLFGISPLPIKPRANITARTSEVSRRPANLLHTRPPQAATSPNSIRDLDGHQSDDPEDWEECTSLPGLSIDVEPEPPGPDNLQATLQDEATWRLWDKEDLPSIASKLFHPNLRKEPCKVSDEGVDTLVSLADGDSLLTDFRVTALSVNGLDAPLSVIRTMNSRTIRTNR